MEKAVLIKIQTILNKQGLAEANAEIDRLKVKASKGKSIFDEFGLAFRRAFIVAPVWMIGRQALQEMIQFGENGIKTYLENSKALLQVSAALGKIGEKEAVLGQLNKSFRQLSIESGESVVNIAKAFTYLKQTIGNTTTASEVLRSSIKLAEASGGNLQKIAESMAHIARISGTGDMDKLVAQIYGAGTRTPGGVEQILANFKEMAPSIELLNLPMDKMVILFEKLNQSGLKSSRLLQTGLMKLFGNLYDYAKKLNIPLSENINEFELFQEVLAKIGANMQGGNVKGSGLQIIKELFGAGGRGGAVPIGILAKDIDSLMKAWQLPSGTNKDIYLLNQQMKELENNADHQIERFNNLKKLLGEAFVSGIGGGGGVEGIQSMNKTMKELGTVMEGLGKSFAPVLQGFMFLRAMDPSSWFGPMIDNIISGKLKLNNALQFNSENFGALGGPMRPAKMQQNKLDKDLANFSDKQDRIRLAIQGQLDLQETQSVMQEVLTEKEKEKYGITYKTFLILKDIIAKKQLEEMESEIDNELAQKNIQLLKDQIKEINKISELYEAVGGLVGANASDMIREEMSLRGALGTQYSIEAKMKDRFKLAKAIADETQREQDLLKKSSFLGQMQEMINGPEYTRATTDMVAKYLGGGAEFTDLGQWAKEALKKYFPEKYKEGELIDWAEKNNIKTPEMYAEQKRLQDNVKAMKEAGIKIDINLGLDTGKSSDLKEVKSKLSDAISNYIKTDPEIKQIISEIAVNEIETY